MIKKIEVIKNLGVFADFNWDRDFSSDVKNQFKKINIIYGRNYSGKTTISRILRSLETKSLPLKFVNPKFELRFEDSSVITESEIGTQNTDIRVFNEDFIFSNLKFLSNPDEEIAPFAILGSDNTAIETAINQLQTELGKNEENEKSGLYKERFDASNKYMQLNISYQNKSESLEEKIKTKALDKTHGIKYNSEKFGDINYNAPKLKMDISNVISKEYSPLNQEQIKQNNIIISEQEKGKIPLYVVPILKYDAICMNAKEMVSREIGKSNKISELLLDIALNEWVSKGLKLHEKKSVCSFCGNTITKERREKLNAHFDEDTRKLESEITNLIAKIEEEIANVKRSLIIDKSVFYSNFLSNISQVISAFEMQSSKYIEQLNIITKQLISRKENIIKPIEFSTPVNISGFLIDVYNSYAQLIQECNEYSKKSQTNKTKAQKELRLNEVFFFCKTISYDTLSKEISALEVEKNSAYEVVKSLEAIIRTKEFDIDAKKRQLNDEEEGALQVNKYLNDYFGHQFLKLQAETVDDGSSRIRFNIVRNGNIAFNLSEGEKSLIAFCYFMAKLRDVTTEEKKPIIWIDDPISSLDSNHVFFIYTLLRTEIIEADKAEQLFVSTHNLDFFKYLKRLTGNDKDKNMQYYMVQRVEETSNIMLLPNHLKDFVTEFNFLFSEIYKCSQITVVDDDNYKSFYNFGNNARKFLEILLHYLYPDNSKQIDKLEKFFGQGRSPAVLTDRINNEYSHLCGVFERGETPVEVPEMLTTAKLIIETIKIKNTDQYNALLNSIGENLPQTGGAQ